jgi:hypothetical protein
MLKRVGLALAILFTLLVLAIALLIISALFFGHSSLGTTLPGGRSVSASADSWIMGVETTNSGTAIFRTAGLAIEVAPAMLSVNGVPFASIPADAKAIEIRVEDGEIEFIADGRKVQRESRSKSAAQAP